MKDEVILSVGNPKETDAMRKTPYIQVGKNKEIFISPGNAEATNDDEKIPHIRIGAMKNGEMQGNFWIADYKVSARTGGNSITSMSAGLDVLSLPGMSLSGNDNSVSDQIDALSYSAVKPDLETFSASNGVNEWFILDDTNAYKGDSTGLKIQTAGGNGGIIALTPNESENIGLLGTKDLSWDSAFISKIFMYDEFVAFDGGKQADWYYVATQSWVTGVVVPLIQKRMKQINSIYWSKTEHLLDGLSKLKDVGDIKFDESDGKVKITAQKYSITPRANGWGVDVSGPDTGNEQEVAATTHGHQLSFQGGNLTLSTTISASVEPCEIGSKDIMGVNGSVFQDLSDLFTRIAVLEAIDHTKFASSDHSHGYLTSFSNCPYYGHTSSGSDT